MLGIASTPLKHLMKLVRNTLNEGVRLIENPPYPYRNTPLDPSRTRPLLPRIVHAPVSRTHVARRGQG